MYIAQQKSRKYANLPDCAVEIDKERREFIRYSALALLAHVKFTPDSSPEHEGRIMTNAWSRAKHLWDTRPEDC